MFCENFFGDRLRSLRLSHDLTLSQLAAQLQSTKATIANYENGNKPPSLKMVIKIATHFDVSVDYLLGTTDQPKVCKERHLPLYSLSVSAGNGTFLSEGHEYENIAFDTAPNGADFALKVCGDSMIPMYADGDIVFVRSQVLVESGQIGVFVLNGEGFLKQLQGNRLVSLNSKYDPIIVGEFDEFFCAGRVIGKQ